MVNINKFTTIQRKSFWKAAAIQIFTNIQTLASQPNKINTDRVFSLLVTLVSNMHHANTAINIGSICAQNTPLYFTSLILQYLLCKLELYTCKSSSVNCTEYSYHM